MTSASVWKNMWAVAAQAAGDTAQVTDQPWLEICESSGICIYCDGFYEDVMNTKVYQEGYSGNDDYLAAPNLNWRDAVTPRGATGESSSADGSTRWDDAQMDFGSGTVLKCRDSTKALCNVADSVWPASDDDCTTDYTPGIIGTPSTTCPGAGTDIAVGTNDKPCILTPATGTAGTAFIATPETCLPSTGPIEVTNDNNNGWSDIIANYTYARGSEFAQKLLRCEMALTAHLSLIHI